jgi:hypothetical protein
MDISLRNYPFGLALTLLTSAATASKNIALNEVQLSNFYSTTWATFAKNHPPHKHCQGNSEKTDGFIRCFLDEQKIEGISGWKAEFLFFNGALIELQLTRPTDTPATYDNLKDRLTKTLWQPIASEINDPNVNVRDAKINRGSEATSWTYRETRWKQEFSGNKHREVMLNESISFPRDGSRSTKPQALSIRVKNYKDK